MIVDLLVAFFLALIFSALLVGGFGWRRPGRGGPGAAMLFLFFIFFFWIWVVSVWVQPVGPVLWNVAWLPLLVAGVIFGLLVLVAVPRTTVSETPSPAAVGLNGAFWALLLSLLLLAVVGSMWKV